MYDKHKIYKFHVNTDDFKSIYTGSVVSEDEHSVRILTIKGENIILKKQTILKSKDIHEEMRNGKRSL